MSLGDPAVLERFWREQAAASVDTKDFFVGLAQGMSRHFYQIDEEIKALLQNWKFDRIERVDLAVLRLGVYELMFAPEEDRPDAPVILNEMIEIARKFGAKDSPSFVNGILDAVAKKTPPPNRKRKS